MGKLYVRFSAPGGQGYIPGTSKNKFRNDWIEAPSFSMSFNSYNKTIDSVSFPHQHDKTSERLQNFAVNGVKIDKVIIERVNDDGVVSDRVVMEGALIDSFTQSRNGNESVVLIAHKTLFEEIPIRKRVGDLSLAHGIRSVAFTA